MSQFIYFTPEEKARAQNTDLVSLLRAQGERPVRSGREFRTPNDPSITVRGNKWFDHSARVGGYAVSFVQRYYRLPYQEAVLLLLSRKNRKTYEQAKPVNEVSKAFALPEPYGTMRRMYAYLMRQRHINREVISAFVHEKLLYEDKHHNCVFVGLDGSGETKHAHIRSTNSEGQVFRMNIEGSASEHCFHKNGTDKSLYVFEAPIDLLSHIMLVFLLAALENDEDKKLFTEIYEQYRPQMERTAMHFLKSHADIEDAVQNAFMQMIRHFEKIYEIPCEELSFWIISIVKNEALMIIRKSQKTVPLEDWDGLVRESENTSDYTELVDLFTKLPPSYRSVLEMKILHGFSDKEVAAHLGISETAVSSRASRGRSLLREIVKKEGFCI